MLEWLLSLLPDSPAALRVVQLFADAVTVAALGVVALASYKAHLLSVIATGRADHEVRRARRELKWLKGKMRSSRSKRSIEPDELGVTRVRSKFNVDERGWRQLTAAQRGALLRGLSEHGKESVSVVQTVNELEVSRYTDDLVSVLAAAGWEVKRTTYLRHPKFLSGVWVCVPDTRSRPGGADILGEELRKAGLRPRVAVNSNLKNGYFELRVGRRG